MKWTTFVVMGVAIALVVIKLFLANISWSLVCSPVCGAFMLLIVYAFLEKQLTPDMLYHAAVSMSLMILFSVLINIVNKSVCMFYISGGVVFLIGLSKEIIYDKMMGKGSPSYKDMIANVVGIILGVSFVFGAAN